MRTILDIYADDMRRAPTQAEGRLHNALMKSLAAFEVRLVSQEPVAFWIADFMIYPQRIVIEVDGGYHRTEKQHAYDARRDAAMKRLGIRVLRFTNARVLGNTAGVVKEILNYCGELPIKKTKSEGEVRITYCPPAYASGHKGGYSQRRSDQRRLEMLAFNARYPKR